MPDTSDVPVVGLRDDSEIGFYVDTKVNPVLDRLVQHILKERPSDPIPCMISWLCTQVGADDPLVKKSEHQAVDNITRIRATESSDDASASDDDDEEDDDEEFATPPATQRSQLPRASVSSEVYGEHNKPRDFAAPVFPKTAVQRRRILEVLESCFLFGALNRQDMEIIADAMEEVVITEKTRIIRQGEDGDALYVVDTGVFKCFKKIQNCPDTSTAKTTDDSEMGIDQECVVQTCLPGDAFGELALLYCCPRAASVEADSGRLWKLDRESFCQIVKDAAIKKRNMYEAFLRNVSLLNHLGAYELSKIADALKKRFFEKEMEILSQGECGDAVYFVEEGEVEARYQPPGGGTPEVVATYGFGECFGEAAIIGHDSVQPCSVVAKSFTKVVYLDRKSFKRLLGPIEAILLRKVDKSRLDRHLPMV